MTSFLSLTPALPSVISPFTDRTKPQVTLLNRGQFGGFPTHRPFLRGSLCVARFGFRPGLLPDLDGSEGVIKELFDRAEGVLYTIADAAVSSSESVASTTQQNGDWLSGITHSMETILKVLKDGLSTLHVPYAYGFAIILLTVLVKAATFPLTKKQVESAMAMRSLQPQIKAIQQRYAGDQERIQLETARLYKLAGINPLAGCLPTLATIPVWIGLYRALSNVANEGLLTEGFFWIPSLSGPTTIAAKQNGSGISWLFPFVDWQPPLGWSDTLAYLVLPVLLVISQYISIRIMQSSQSNDANMKGSQALTNFLPLMIGYFALSVPSGLSLYWFTNNILSTAQQVWLQKLGGAKNLLGQQDVTLKGESKPFFDDISKEEQSHNQKSLTELNSTRKAAKQEEKLTSEGLLPGERFKQIKEQEARGRQKREEERRKAEEATAKVNQLTNGAYEGEDGPVKKNGVATGLGDEKNEKLESVEGQDSSKVGVILNGDLSSQDMNEDKMTSPLSKENSESSEHIEKEEFESYPSAATGDNKHFEDKHLQAGRE
ncbi:hypothetical protein SLEP1_g50808 [Rubroshorea leprosula]|uniref:Membrane insertase YidC/Oxa/ALB C-terminal domain-containing protein n=1 Tax=Rubroshorea leprosula TaxID=152421 RepID=A0AAV5M4P8_9ROSI|nr:hypothetical protein SLEP1_g50808 [Rubroshorea leprosula]